MKIEAFQTKQSFDIKSNTTKIISLYQNSNADVCIFPELATIGYLPKDELLSIKFVEKCLEHNKQIILQTNTKAIIFGSIVIIENKLHNAAIVAQNGKIIDISTKKYLPNDGVFNESRYFINGNPKVIKINNINFGILICEDSWHEDSYKQIEDADIICSINASPFEYFINRNEIGIQQQSKLQKRIDKMQKHAQNKTFIYCNCIGFYNGILFDGNSFLLSNQFQQLNAFKEESLLFNYPPQHIAAPTHYDGSSPNSLSADAKASSGIWSPSSGYGAPLTNSTNEDNDHFFETITLVPIQEKSIDFSLLTPEEIEWVKEYNKKCMDNLLNQQ